MKKRLKKWTLEKFGPIFRFYTKNSSQNSWSPHFKNYKLRGPPVCFYLYDRMTKRRPFTPSSEKRLHFFIICLASKNYWLVITNMYINNVSDAYIPKLQSSKELIKSTNNTDKNILDDSYLIVTHFLDFPLWENRIAYFK